MSYYGSAIRRNHSSVQNMLQAIWAIFLHKLSNDEYPQHGFCPIGEDSWSGFKNAEASGKSYKQKNSLPVAVVEAMRPIFRDLSHPDLLKKCLHGKTQNSNESFHNVIWSHVSKATFVQIETLSLGVYDVVCSFNDGNVSKLKIIQKMGVERGEYSISAMKLLDTERLMKAIYAFSGRSKKLENIKEEKERKKIILRKINLAKEARDIDYKCTTITLDDADAVAKHRIMNHTFKKPLVTEFDCPIIITSTIARLRTEHLKGMKIHPDKTRSYVQYKHCPDLQFTPNHILECPTVATKLLKMERVHLQDSLREILYRPDALRIAEAVIKTFDGN
ncbi:uncharacterized protein TNCV_3429061 [Trichonephila clavipes]|nr:uncharacterized protein TNCV_3429061 [Trichonephila clavipes]